MGAVDISRDVWTNGDAKQAWSDTYDQDRYEYGARGYTGSFAETNGVVVYHRDVKSLDGAILQSRYDQSFDYRHAPVKWEAAVAAPILSDDAFVFTKRKLSLTVDEVRTALERPESQRTIETYDITEAALKIVIGEKREAVPGAFVHSITVDYVPKFKYVTESAKGTAKTVYVAMCGAQFITTKGTRAEANAAAKEYLAKHTYNNFVQVKAMKQYEGFDPGVTSVIRRELVSAKITVTVTYGAKRARIPADVKKGWYLTALASS